MEVIHISVDGTLRNSNVKVGVVLWAVVISLLVARTLVLRGRPRRWAILAAVSCLSCLIAPWMVRFLALLTQSVLLGRFVSTTFFGSPPFWLSPAVGIAGGLVAGVLLNWRARSGATRLAG
jgi:hypothetical protein